jgi:hypothetical protein
MLRASRSGSMRGSLYPRKLNALFHALAHADLGAVDVVGRERGVGGAAGQLDHVALFVGHEAVLGVGLADAAQVADIVRQGCQDDMQPHVGWDVGAQAPPAQDVLRHQCHQGGVLGGVIERIAERQPFDHQPRRFAQELGLLRHRAPVAAHERRDQAVRQGVSEEGGSLEHQRCRRVVSP